MSFRNANGQPAKFYTPEGFARDPVRGMEPPRGRLLVAGCRAGAELAAGATARYTELLRDAGSELNALFLENIDRRFSDSEVVVRLDHHVSGYDVFVFQSLLDAPAANAVDQNYMALLSAVRAFREHGANHVTAVLPYLAYARQDKPTQFKREPTTARLMADLTVAAGADRIIAWHPHSDQIRGFYGKTTVNMLDPTYLFVNEFKRFAGREDVIVIAPDAGASKYVMQAGRLLGLTTAITSKHRPEPEAAVASEIIGDFRGKRIAIILDDIMSSAGTIHAVGASLAKNKGIQELYIGISHNLCSARARKRLLDLHERFGLKQAVFTNSIPRTNDFADIEFVKILSLAGIFARVINRIHYNRSVSEIFSNGTMDDAK